MSKLSTEKCPHCLTAVVYYDAENVPRVPVVSPQGLHLGGIPVVTCHECKSVFLAKKAVKK